jgi:hypothetical protein
MTSTCGAAVAVIMARWYPHMHTRQPPSESDHRSRRITGVGGSPIQFGSQKWITRFEISDPQLCSSSWLSCFPFPYPISNHIHMHSISPFRRQRYTHMRSSPTRHHPNAGDLLDTNGMPPMYPFWQIRAFS